MAGRERQKALKRANEAFHRVKSCGKLGRVAWLVSNNNNFVTYPPWK